MQACYPNDPISRKLVPPKTEKELPRLADPFDPATDVNQRGRAYLHANCGHCHRFNGGGSSFIYLLYDLPLKDIKALSVRPTQGSFGIHEAQIIAPGDPFRSVLYFRLAKTGPGHMPHLGAKFVDQRGLSLIHDWIRQLPVRLDDATKIDQLISIDEPTVLAREKEELPRTFFHLSRQIAEKAKRNKPNETDLAKAEKEAAEGVGGACLAARRVTAKNWSQELLATPSRALQLAIAIRERRLPEATNRLTLEAAMSRTDLAIRDLFEPFVPEEQRTKRLGDSLVVEEFLKVMGDVERGRQLFHESKNVQCRSCHRVNGKRGSKWGRTSARLARNLIGPSCWKASCNLR